MKMKSSRPQTYRQGDVLIVRVDSIPDDAQRAKPGNPVLAYGEVTGHHHQVQSGGTACLLETPAKVVFLDLREASLLTHQEHATITLPPGKYRIGHQREYSPAEIRRVVD
jgi:hypothetical protein